MMIGGPKEAVDHLDPIFAALAPGLGDIPRTPGREKAASRAERGYIHAGPSGAGHFVKMVHNGIEYGLMQAYAEGFDILRNKDSKDLPEDERFVLNMPDIAEVWRRGSVISSWLLDLGAAALAKDPQLKDFSGYVQDSGEGRWTVEAAIEEAVPADVLSTALYARFRSRQEHNFGEKMLSAMRFGFGGHIEGNESIDPEPKPKEVAGSPGGTERRGVAPCPTISRSGHLRARRQPESPPRRQVPPADPCAMVVFGAGGDMTKRLLIPALYNLSRTKVLPEKFALIGVDLAEGTAESWRDHLYDMLKTFVGNATAEFDIDRIDEAAWKRLAEKMSYIQGDLTKPELYEKIRGALGDAEKTHGTQGNAIFYLAVADRFFGTVVEQLGKAKLTDQGEDKNGKPQFWRRVVIEKPFGHSLDSARELNARILRTLHEDQIFRIDHFLGKDTVQSIMAFRFANGLFEPIWNRDRIDHVQITVAETVGVEERGKFYEETGALRDMVPNHVFTLLSMVAMEPPTGFDAASIRTKKAEVFAAMPAVKPAQAVRGQYGAGTVLGKPVKAYRNEPNVAADSNIETYVAMQLEIDNWRWAGVPFYFRTGKHMSQRTDGDRDPLQAGALRGVPGHRRRDLAAQLAGAAHRAGRRHFPAVRGQAPRAGGRPRRREDGLPLR